MVLFQRSLRFWVSHCIPPTSASSRLISTLPSRSQESSRTRNSSDSPSTGDHVWPLGPPSTEGDGAAASSTSSAPSTDDSVLPLGAPPGSPSSSEQTARSDVERSLSSVEDSDSAVMQELLKQQQDQLQKEKDLREEEHALQKEAGRKLKAFELLSPDRSTGSTTPSVVSWADPVSVAEATAAASTAAAATPPSASSSIPSISTEEFKKRLAEWKCALDRKSRELAQQADKNFSLLGLRVNEVTGYREVELLKEAVKNREREIEGKRKDVREAKLAYETAVTTLSKTQQDVQALLERKHTWSDHDVAHFTHLVRSDHASKTAVETTSQQLKEAELAVDTAFTALMQSILERYHEEQVWSDKIRSVSTWASLVVLGANLIVFIGAIAFVEPWKRKRLVEGLEERMTGMMTKVDSQLQTLSDHIGSLETAPSSVLAVAPAAAVNGDPAGVLSTDSDLTTTTAATATTNTYSSPIHALEPHLTSVPCGPQAFAWSTNSLDKLAPPSAERDLAAAAAVGAVAGAITIGLISVIASIIRH